MIIRNQSGGSDQGEHHHGVCQSAKAFAQVTVPLCSPLVREAQDCHIGLQKRDCDEIVYTKHGLIAHNVSEWSSYGFMPNSFDVKEKNRAGVPTTNT